MNKEIKPVTDPLLAESEARYQAVIENASDMIQSVRPDGSFEFVNRAWEQKLGYGEDELGDLSIWSIIPDSETEHCQLFFQKAMQGEQLDNVRTHFLAKNGREIPVEGSVTSRVVDGQIVATHAFFRDISEQLRSQELEAENQRLEQEQHARYLEKMAALGKLSAGLSHELNNPAAAAQRASVRLTESLDQRDQAAGELAQCGLSGQQWDLLGGLISPADARDAGAADPLETNQREEAIEAWLDLHEVADAWNLAPSLVRAAMTDADLDSLAELFPAEQLPAATRWIAAAVSVRESAEIVTRSTHRISELIAAVKAYSFMDRAVEQEVDVHDGIENTLVILAHRLRDITIKRDYDRNLPHVRAFGSGLNQVWTNIIDNAIDAVSGRGEITIRTSRGDHQVIVEVIDNGCGIPEANVSRVFEPFFTTKPQGSGTGLGLDIVWRIVTQDHAGTIDVESVPGRTVFRVTLPIA